MLALMDNFFGDHVHVWCMTKSQDDSQRQRFSAQGPTQHNLSFTCLIDTSGLRTQDRISQLWAFNLAYCLNNMSVQGDLLLWLGADDMKPCHHHES